MITLVLFLMLLLSLSSSSPSSTTTASSSSTSSTSALSSSSPSLTASASSSIAFCFLITKDLIKENLWKQWFNRLPIDYDIYVHTNNIQNIQSLWLKQYIIPNKYIKITKWGSLGNAITSLYEYAYIHKKHQWFILLSESHVPFISPLKFMIKYNIYKENSLIEWKHSLDISSQSWDAIDRCNYHYFPKEYWLHHEMWIILTYNDIKDIINIKDNNNTKIIYDTLVSGKIADECFIAVILKISNNMINILNITTTILDWEHNINSPNHPYVFNSYNDYNRKLLNQKRQDNDNGMFLRKISNEFPDYVLENFIA